VSGKASIKVKKNRPTSLRNPKSRSHLFFFLFNQSQERRRKKVSFGLVRVREFFPDTFEPIHLATTKIFSQILSSNVRKKKKTSVCLMISFSHFRKKGKYGTECVYNKRKYSVE
jgi:hypothetical protein